VVPPRLSELFGRVLARPGAVPEPAQRVTEGSLGSPLGVVCHPYRLCHVTRLCVDDTVLSLGDGLQVGLTRRRVHPVDAQKRLYSVSLRCVAGRFSCLEAVRVLGYLSARVVATRGVDGSERLVHVPAAARTELLAPAGSARLRGRLVSAQAATAGLVGVSGHSVLPPFSTGRNLVRSPRAILY